MILGGFGVGDHRARRFGVYQAVWPVSDRRYATSKTAIKVGNTSEVRGHFICLAVSRG